MTDRPSFVIVGASLAGARAAETLREEGFDGRIVLVGAEPEPPYERPPLSKEYLRGESDRAKTHVHPEGFYEQHNIELLLGRTVTGLAPDRRLITIDGGETLPFDRLLLATGAEPRRLTVPGAELAGVYELRDLHDATTIRERIARGGKLVVIGAGWIGAEVAASARQKGLEVAIVEQATLPLERVLGPEVGAVYRDIHLDHGVELLADAQLEAFEGRGSVERVGLADGRRIDCDFVVVGIGVTPRTQLAAQAGLEVANGIVVDEHLQTSVPGIFAAGDVANVPHPLFGRLRVEHWANALNQGPVAGRNMLGRGEAYEHIPYFFSDQYDVGMEYSGHASARERLVFRGDPESREFIAFWLDGEHVVAGMNVNVWDVADPIQALIASRKPVEPGRLADPDIPLAELAEATR